jgi:hypothetical protein
MRVESDFFHDHSLGIEISGSIFLSLQQNLCKPSFTVIMTDIQKLNFSVSVTQLVFEFCHKSLFFNVNKSK